MCVARCCQTRQELQLSNNYRLLPHGMGFKYLIPTPTHAKQDTSKLTKIDNSFRFASPHQPMLDLDTPEVFFRFDSKFLYTVCRQELDGDVPRL